MRRAPRFLLPLLLAGSCLAALPAAAAPLSEEAVRAKADALIAQMTPEEKAGQLTQFFYFQGFAPMNKAPARCCSSPIRPRPTGCSTWPSTSRG